VALAGPVAHRKQLEVHSDVAQSSRDAKKSQLSPTPQTGCSIRPSRRGAHGFVKGNQTFRLAVSVWMLNFRRKVISKVSQSVSFFAVPQRSPHRDEHVRLFYDR
jgi:hypothetical protein